MKFEMKFSTVTQIIKSIFDKVKGYILQQKQSKPPQYWLV